MRPFPRLTAWAAPACGVACAVTCAIVVACSAGGIVPSQLSDDVASDGGGTTLQPGSDAGAGAGADAGDGNGDGNGNDAGTLPSDGNNAANPNAGGNDPVTVPGGATQAFRPGVAMYWGIGNDNGQDPDLSTLCQDSDISIIILSFVDAVASYSKNANGNPHMSMNGCEGQYNAANPHLLKCTALGSKIAACQKAGKQVVLSLGGAGAQVGFLSETEATNYATLLWNMFLGGNGTIRPFGTATLDGIDLDIENGTVVGYGALVTKLRALMDADSTKPYLITAAPQCPFPDDWIGPDGTRFDGNGSLKGTALSLNPNAFDHLFVQFYNNFCSYTSPSQFAAAWTKWTGIAGKQPRVWVGLPAAASAADGYVQGSSLAKIAASVGKDAAFGGFMFWDAGYDADTLAAGNKPMRQWAAEAINGVLGAP